MNQDSSTNLDHRAWQAMGVWLAFIIVVVLLNGTIPFALGNDMRAWSFSTAKGLLFGLLIFGGPFLVVPLILTKGWRTVRQPIFLLALAIALSAITLLPIVRAAPVLAVVMIAFLHWRFDLSDLNIPALNKGDWFAILAVGLLSAVPALLQGGTQMFSFGDALLAALDRMFANPSSTVENLFYFGFLTERLASKLGKWLTPPLIGLMYTGHELSNPE
jgi:hypothetical protein